MPRTSTSQRERKNSNLVGLLDHYQNCRLRNGDHIDAVAKTLGFSTSTYYKRLRQPDTFTLGELHAVASVLNVSVGALLGEGAS